jgi:RNA polymerase sigma-B factor
LPARERTILHLRFFEGLTQSEIAERVGISQMHVTRLIRNSLDRMRRELESGEHAASRARGR